ncbi:NAD-dependent succinate-semialdehyde dehydrogenase [Bremerella cremea]|uniref:Succinate-semialdehyde dehydrogenase n=1 Tax=Blastopirellula marina TaxID=124 RepID=A0A2S8FCL0_9BACT|nr:MULTISPECIES: NAD-dependent succinate-semialdehyde dehydrogenase [Pirellulaceae]PQO29896.1 succinate-semialdehyde dehydrogenase [Blastopirellula marina]RCS43199.1 NAD-dependent succinate-semialdehyde dehydrogenase [Bremerella cremea]
MSNEVAKDGLKSINPYNGEVLRTYDEMSPTEVDSAIAKADGAFRQWRETSYEQRAEILRRAAKLLRERREELAEIMTLEMGKKIEDSRPEIDLCATIFDYYADNGADMLAPKDYDTPEGKGTLVNQPVGIVYGIQPWNFPFYQPSRVAAPQIMAGNVVLTKHASNVPQCAEAFDQLLKDAGVPEGVHTNLRLSARNAGSIIDDDRVQGVAFTGSNKGGAAVAEQAGRNVKKTVMELGGVDPFIVLEDADMDATIERFKFGKLHATGQICIAAKRIILVESIAQEFLDRATKLFACLKPGNPLEESTGYGPVCNEKAAIQLERQINDSVAAGAKLLVGGKRDGAFIQPTIMTDIPKGSPADREELFGPVALIHIAKDEEDAIRIANDSDFGLGGSVHTNDLERGRRVAERIESGTCFVNQISWTYASMPMGGVKKSGYGRELADLGIMEFVNQKLICVFDKDHII